VVHDDALTKVKKGRVVEHLLPALRSMSNPSQRKIPAERRDLGGQVKLGPPGPRGSLSSDSFDKADDIFEDDEYGVGA
jgi:hypothetical protein